MRTVRYSTGNAEFDASDPPRVFFADRTMVIASMEFTERPDDFDPDSKLIDFSDPDDPISFHADALGIAGTNVGRGVLGELQIDPKVVAPEAELVILEEGVDIFGPFTTYRWEYYYSSADILSQATFRGGLGYVEGTLEDGISRVSFFNPNSPESFSYQEYLSGAFFDESDESVEIIPGASGVYTGGDGPVTFFLGQNPSYRPDPEFDGGPYTLVSGDGKMIVDAEYRPETLDREVTIRGFSDGDLLTGVFSDDDLDSFPFTDIIGRPQVVTQGIGSDLVHSGFGSVELEVEHLPLFSRLHIGVDDDPGADISIRIEAEGEILEGTRTLLSTQDGITLGGHFAFVEEFVGGDSFQLSVIDDEGNTIDGLNSVGELIEVGETVRNEGETAVRVRFPDDSLATIGRGSTVTLDALESSDPSLIQKLNGVLREGTLRYFRDPDSESPDAFFETPAAAIGVRGTELEVSYEEDSEAGVGVTTVKVFSGNVDVTNKATGQVTQLGVEGPLVIETNLDDITDQPPSDPGDGNLVEGTDGDDFLEGTDGDDTAIGNGGNDQFNLGAGDDTAFVGEGSAFIRAGSGDDTYHFTDILEGWVSIGYGHLTDSSILADGLTVDVDGAANTGSIVKGGLGTDTLVDAENPLFSGWTTGGLSIDGTLGADTFNITLDDLQWMAIRPGDGVDSYDINASASERPDADFSVGALRLDIRGGDGIDIDLSTGEILDDGFGNVEQIEGNAPIWEVWGSEGDDRFVGSDNVESYRYAGGSNDLDAGVGFDRLRYDVAEVASVDIDAENGVVNGTLSGGGTFTDTIAGFQHLRGSNGNDRIAGDSNDNLLEGWGGDDAFVLVGGDDTVDGGDGNDQVFFGVTKDEAAVTSEGAGTHTVVIGSDRITLTSIEELVFEESGLTPPAPSAAAPAWTLGDPHLLTLDGLGYDFHAVGEYVLLQGQSGESVNGFEIQSRMTPAKDDAGADLDDVSVNQAIAMRAANGDAVMIDSNDADPLSVGGTVETIEVGDFLDVGVDRIYRAGDTYTMVFAGDDGTLNDGDTQVAVKVHDGRVDLSVRISDELAGRIEGLLGDGDGDKSNDVARADGTVLEHPLAFEDLYGGYRDDWRVDDEADSLFTYDAGERLAGFYDPDKPGSVTTVDDFDPADQEAARQAAEDAGLTPGSVNYDNAVLDFLLTGDPGFVESSASEDVAAPETASVAPTLDVGQERVTIQFTVTDRAGDGIEDALVGFSTGASTARSLAEDDGGGLYSLSVGEGASGRIGGSMEFTNTGEIAVGDALEVLRIAVGLDPSWGAAQGLDFVAADVNRDGQVTVGDALEVLRSAVGLESDNAPEWVFLDPDLDVLGVTADNVTYDTGMETGPLETKSLELTGVLLGSLQGAPEA